MNTNLECEAKGLISQNDFEKILKNNEVDKIINQTNYYFDNNDQLKNLHMALRIREKNNSYEITTKKQTKNGMIETNIPITKEVLKLILSTHCIEDDLVSKLNLPFSEFNTIKEIKTKRYVILFNNYHIEVDKSTFKDTIDYEIEVEAKNLEIANLALNDFCKENDISIKPSQAKIARYDLYNNIK